MITESKKETKITDFFDRKKMQQYRADLLSPIKSKIGMFYMLPMGALAGLKVTQLDDETCKVTAPYKFLNKNPFNTTYWAVLGMAAEMAGGAILLMYTKNAKVSVANFVIGSDSKFINRALGLTTFVTNDGLLIKEKVEEAIQTGKAVTFTTTSIGYDENDKIISEFIFTWSVKARKKA